MSHASKQNISKTNALLDAIESQLPEEINRNPYFNAFKRKNSAELKIIWIEKIHPLVKDQYATAEKAWYAFNELGKKTSRCLRYPQKFPKHHAFNRMMDLCGSHLINSETGMCHDRKIKKEKPKKEESESDVESDDGDIGSEDYEEDDMESEEEELETEKPKKEESSESDVESDDGDTGCEDYEEDDLECEEKELETNISEDDPRNFPDRQGVFSLYAYKGDLKNGLRANTNICLWRRDGQSLLQKYLRDKELWGNSIFFNSSMVYSCWENRPNEFLEVKVKCVANSGRYLARDSIVELLDIDGIEQTCIDGKFHELDLEPYVSYAEKKKEEDALNGMQSNSVRWSISE